MAFVKNLMLNSSMGYKGLIGTVVKGKCATVLSSSLRLASTYPIDDNIFGLSDEQKQVCILCMYEL